jgi:uncharacterized repeat protein (TIGR03803 family)
MQTMSRKTVMVCAGVFAFLVAIGRPESARAQSYEILHSFNADAGWPNALLYTADGRIYGTTQLGGALAHGSVFVLTPNGIGFDFSTVWEFSGGDGGFPLDGVIQGSDGNFYGTTSQGGANGGGTVFRISPSGALTTLHNFAGSDGRRPGAGLVQGADGNFYGTTSDGGANGFGTVYRIDNAGSFTVVHSFVGCEESATRLVQATDGYLYWSGSRNGCSHGAVFRIDTAGTVTTLYNFSTSWDGPDGFYPSQIIQGNDGAFYGTSQGGVLGGGTIFRIDGSGSLTVLHNFRTDEPAPSSGLAQGSDGSFYGVTKGGFSVFRLDGAGAFTTLHVFNDSEGKFLFSGVIVGGDGSLYGSASRGGPNLIGTVFQIDRFGAFSTVHSFANAEGYYSYAGLVRGSDGRFYGTTMEGGPDDKGAFFRVDTSGLFSTLYTFNPGESDAYWYDLVPDGALVEGGDSSFYGTTAGGGNDGRGTVYRVDAFGTFSVLHTFNSNDDGAPTAGLVAGPDGNLYGTTSYGTFFRIDGTGLLTTLHTFGGVESPRGALTLGSDGSFYGTTIRGPAYGQYGSVFRVDLSGALTVLHAFSGGDDGGHPAGGLVRRIDGSVYGTTTDFFTEPYEVSIGNGTVFRIDASGSLTTLHRFTGNDGTRPSAKLVEAIDGYLYGTTLKGGAYGCGTIFRISPTGLLTTIHHFTGDDGSTPVGALVQDTDGRFYGTTRFGGPSWNGHPTTGGGVVFRFTPPPNTVAGEDVPVEVLTAPNPTTLVFDNVITDGATTVTAIDPATVGDVPGGFAVSGSVAYEVHTSATFSGPITIAFVVPGPMTEAEFNTLAVLHNDNGVLVDVTASSPARNYQTRTIYAITNSLSPFYIVRAGPHISMLFDRAKAYKSGSTVPVKLRLLDSGNVNVSSPNTTLTARSLIRIGGSTATSVLDAGSANPDNTFRYDASLGGYIFNLSTKGLASGRYALSVWAGADRAFSYNIVFEVR